jgi:hypothetical protein
VNNSVQRCGLAQTSEPRSRTQDPVYQTVFKICYFVLQPQITGPLYVRLAFHDAATWNRNTTRQGGCAPGAPWPSGWAVPQGCRPTLLVVARGRAWELRKSSCNMPCGRAAA